jgi:hypothetical protein
MASSFKDKPYRLPNFGVDGAVPRQLRQPRWTSPHSTILPGAPTSPWAPLPSPPPGPNPFPDIPQKKQFRDVDPPEQNPFNDPDYSPLVTDNFSRRAVGAPAGGLLALLREVMQQSDRQPEADFGPNTEDAQSNAREPRPVSSRPVRMLVARRVRQ